MKRVGLVVAMIAGAAAVSGGGGATRVTDTLALRVQEATRGLVITNLGPADISDCSVLVNSRFRREAMTFPRGVAVSLPGASLIGDGLRYEPGVDSPDRIHVICRQPTFADALFKLR